MQLGIQEMSFPHNIFYTLVAYAKDGIIIRGSSHAAAITYKGKIISIGRNQLKTHPIMKKYGKNDKAIFLHAEIDAILRAAREVGPEFLSKCTLYVLRVTKGGVVSNSCPCSGCARFIKDMNIKEVVFT